MLWCVFSSRQTSFYLHGFQCRGDHNELHVPTQLSMPPEALYMLYCLTYSRLYIFLELLSIREAQGLLLRDEFAPSPSTPRKLTFKASSSRWAPCLLTGADDAKAKTRAAKGKGRAKSKPEVR